jgi:hypothetical protein
MEREFMLIRDRIFSARNKVAVRTFSKYLPYYVVNEFPKSGGTWLSHMMSDALELPFRRNEFVRFEKSVVHGHYLEPFNLHNVIVLWRDPRDIIVSLYYHCYFLNEMSQKMFGNKQIVSLMKERCSFSDYEEIRNNLPKFIRFISTSPLAPRFTWTQFADKWANKKGIVQTKYEDLRADTPQVLMRIVKSIDGSAITLARAAEIAESRSFARAKVEADRKRASSTEMPFVREGAIGGWRNHFSDEALNELIKFGYEKSMARVGYKFD